LKVPKINFNRCVNCGRCYQVCPGKKIEYQISSTNEYEKYLGEIDESFKISQRGITEINEKNKDVMGVVFV